MAEQVTEQRPIILSVNAIVNGAFFSAGTPLPFGSESDLPESLKPFIVSEAAPPLPPPERNIYDLPPATRRQMRKLELAAAEKEWAQEQANEPLREDVAAVLEAEHDLRIGAALKQAEVNAQRVDDTYMNIEEEATARVTQYFVRRGGEWARVQNAKLKPAETCFVKRENGEMEAAGVINSRGEPPPPEITP